MVWHLHKFYEWHLLHETSLKFGQGMSDMCWLKLIFKSSTKFKCCMYRSPNDRWQDAFFSALSSKLHYVLFSFHRIVVLGETSTIKSGRNPQKPTVKAERPNRSPSTTRVFFHNLNILDIYRTSHPESYQISVFSALVRSDHGFITLSLSCML